MIKGWTSEQKAALLHKIILSTVGSILSVAIVLSVSISCKRSLNDNRRKRQEYESLKLMDKKIPMLLNSLKVKDDISNSDSSLRKAIDLKDYVFVTSKTDCNEKNGPNSSTDANLVLLKPFSTKNNNNNNINTSLYLNNNNRISLNDEINCYLSEKR